VTEGKGFDAPRTRLDVQQLHKAWQAATGLTGHSIANSRGFSDAQSLADAIDAHGLADCLLVAKHCKRDAMVNGSADERGQTHESIGYIFGNPTSFARILRTGKKHESTDMSMSERIARARAL
jgi:hypothetical protein